MESKISDIKKWGIDAFEKIVAVSMADDEDIRMGRLFNTLMIISIGYCVTLSVIFLIIWLLRLDLSYKSQLGILFPLASILLSVYCIFLVKRKFLNFAISLYVWSNCAAIFVAIFLYEGVDAPGAWLLLGWTIVISGALLSPREALKMTGLMGCYFLLLLILKYSGVYRPPFTFVGAALKFKDMAFMLAALVFSICILTYLNMKSLGKALANLYEAKAQLNKDRIRLEQKTLELESEIQVRLAAEQEKERMRQHLLQAEKMEAIGTLAGGVAHDFNNLLMGIRGRTSLMMINTSADDPRLEHLKEIEHYIKSAAALSKQLLGFARGGKYDVIPTDLNELAKHQIRMFGRTRKEIVISEKYADDLWPVEVDRSQIDQALLNIFLNAAHAMPNGGSLYIETQNMTLKKSVIASLNLLADRYVQLMIRDTGIGMDEDTRQRIFDPFFTTKDRGRGTGLGLASTYGIIKNHGGFITAESAIGKGSAFRIHLPASSTPLTAEDRKIRITHDFSNEIFHGEETILLVDDEKMILEVGELILSEMGYSVITSTGGEEAIRIYREKCDDIALVILDLIMPGLDGGKTFDRLKQINPEIKVLLSSGYSMDGQAANVMQRGCNGFIQKPYHMKELSKKIREIIDPGPELFENS
ncbi:MAG: response regulator [Desulfobacterales bacterium]|jgi:signal transduction histidine kinase/ActR/RegA family two-component response regulator|nr:response regulator [Desulfobacterales bacterium]